MFQKMHIETQLPRDILGCLLYFQQLQERSSKLIVVASNLPATMFEVQLSLLVLWLREAWTAVGESGLNCCSPSAFADSMRALVKRAPNGTLIRVSKFSRPIETEPLRAMSQGLKPVIHNEFVQLLPAEVPNEYDTRMGQLKLFVRTYPSLPTSDALIYEKLDQLKFCILQLVPDRIDIEGEDPTELSKLSLKIYANMVLIAARRYSELCLFGKLQETSSNLGTISSQGNIEEISCYIFKIVLIVTFPTIDIIDYVHSMTSQVVC